MHIDERACLNVSMLPFLSLNLRLNNITLVSQLAETKEGLLGGLHLEYLQF